MRRGTRYAGHGSRYTEYGIRYTTAKDPMADGKLKVTQVRSTIGFNKKQRDVVRSLGLRRIRHTVEVADTPEMRGIIHKIRHLVTVE